MRDSTANVAFAAYLHDLGKFAERAKLDVPDSVLNTHIQMYCPQKIDNGKPLYYTHKHAAYTALAWDLLEQNVPDLIKGDMYPFAGRSSGEDKTDLLLNAFAMHHKPETFLQWIIVTADSVASGFEREKFEHYNQSVDEREQQQTGKNHYQARLLTLFEQIDIHNQGPAASDINQLQWCYPLKPLSAENIFPKKRLEAEPAQNEPAQAEYRKLWEQFTQSGISEIPKSHRQNWHLWLDHFDMLWQSYTQAIPSATAFGTKPANAPNSCSAAKYESEKLGSFASDIMRLFKTADFMSSETVSTQIQYAVNHKKQAVVKDGKIQVAKGVTGRRETIQYAQYRRFQTVCTIQHLPSPSCLPNIKSPERKLPDAGLQPIDLRQLAIEVNNYHLLLWHKENQILEERNLVSSEWLKQARQLIDDLTPQLEQGSIMLMRLGKNSGAESKTLSRFAQIKITQGKGLPPKYEKQTKTVWLAAQSDKETHGLLPFGWVLIEIDPQSDNTALKQWCGCNSRNLADTAAITAALAQQRQQVAERKQMQKQEQQRIEQEKQAAKAEKQRQAAEQAAALAAMPPEERLIAQWQQKLAEFIFDSRNPQAHSELYQTFSQALQQAAQDFDAETQKSIAEAFSWREISKQQPGLFAGKREKEIKALLRQLRGE